VNRVLHRFLWAAGDLHSLSDDLEHRWTRQYFLTFTAKPQKKSGLQRVKLTTEVPNAELVWYWR